MPLHPGHIHCQYISTPDNGGLIQFEINKYHSDGRSIQFPVTIWRIAAVAASLISMLLLILFWHPWLPIRVVITVVHGNEVILAKDLKRTRQSAGSFVFRLVDYLMVNCAQ